MKKFLLSMMAVSAVFGLFAQSDASLELQWKKIYETSADKWSNAEPVWSNPEAIKPFNCTRVGTGMNGKFYSVNMKTMSIMEFDEEGCRDLYTLPSLQGQTIKYLDTNEEQTPKTIADYYGTLITHDQAGNFIIGHGFITGAMANYFTIYNPKNGESKRFEVTYPTTKTGINLRIDALGRAVGNVFENGFLWVAPTSIYWPSIRGKSWATAENVQFTKMLYFYGEEGNELAENVECVGYIPSEWVAISTPYASICQPAYDNADDVINLMLEQGEVKGLTQSCYVYSKECGNCFQAPTIDENYPNPGQYSQTLGIQAPGYNSVVRPFDFATSDFGANYGGYGFDTFVLDGYRYYVTNYCATQTDYNNSPGTMNIAVYDEEGMLVAKWENDDWYSQYGYSTITCEPVDDKTANIYVFNATTNLMGATSVAENDVLLQRNGAALLTFTAPEHAGIADIVADQNDAPVEYYNLQGVKIANPENGIFICRQGNKVTKVIK